MAVEQKTFMAERETARKILEATREYVTREGLKAPLQEDELRAHAEHLRQVLQCGEEAMPTLALELHNEVWRPVFAQVPYERRLLLLPQCLASSATCKAERDDLGLLCRRCGACEVGRILEEADKLGYASLVAEGVTVVRSLLQSGKIDAVFGVGCLDSLTKVFPLMNRLAIPGLGRPLFQAGCRDTAVDVETVLADLRVYAPGQGGAWVSDAMTESVNAWFEQDALHALVSSDTATAKIGIEWLRTGGKRWRPLLTASIHAAAGGASPELVHAAAVGVECFHKASLIHDDIEDGDSQRYSQPTVHVRHGVPVAINVGDFLIGEGYRLLLQNEFADACKVRLIEVAAQGHRALCLGQGDELAFCQAPHPVTESIVLRIYERKTAAAFEVAVLVGAVAAGLDAAACEALSAFSRAIGIAYQIADDCEDFVSSAGRGADGLMLRPTLFLAAACASEVPEVCEALARAWKGDAEARIALAEAICRHGLTKRAEQLYAYYRHETERALVAVSHAGVQELLRRMTLRILPASVSAAKFSEEA